MIPRGTRLDHDGRVSRAIPRGMRMVMLDSVGIPSGVHVKKPPMIFMRAHQPEESRKAAEFGVNSLASPPP